MTFTTNDGPIAGMSSLVSECCFNAALSNIPVLSQGPVIYHPKLFFSTGDIALLRSSDIGNQFIPGISNGALMRNNCHIGSQVI